MIKSGGKTSSIFPVTGISVISIGGITSTIRAVTSMSFGFLTFTVASITMSFGGTTSAIRALTSMSFGFLTFTVASITVSFGGTTSATFAVAVPEAFALCFKMSSARFTVFLTDSSMIFPNLDAPFSSFLALASMDLGSISVFRTDCATARCAAPPIFGGVRFAVARSATREIGGNSSTDFARL